MIISVNVLRVTTYLLKLFILLVHITGLQLKLKTLITIQTIRQNPNIVDRAKYLPEWDDNE